MAAAARRASSSATATSIPSYGRSLVRAKTIAPNDARPHALLDVGIGGGDFVPRQRLRVVEEINERDVGEARDGHPHDALQRRAKLERAGDDAVGEELERVLLLIVARDVDEGEDRAALEQRRGAEADDALRAVAADDAEVFALDGLAGERELQRRGHGGAAQDLRRLLVREDDAPRGLGDDHRGGQLPKCGGGGRVALWSP